MGAAGLRRYGVALLAMTIAAVLTAVVREVTAVEHAVAAYLAALLFTGWYAGTGPVVLALALALLLDAWLPTTGGGSAGWSFNIRGVWFLAFAVAAGWLGAARRRMLRELDAAREHLEDQVAARTQDLRRKEAHLREIQRIAGVAWWVMSLDSDPWEFRKVLWSEAVHDVFDVNPTANLVNFDQVQARVHPEDRARRREVFETAVRELREFALEFRLIRRDGSLCDVFSAGRPFLDETGKPVEYIGLSMDVTERKQTERALQSARERALRERFEATLAERNRIAHEMHDTLLQGFTGVALNLVAVANRVHDSPDTERDLREVIALAQSTLVESRRAIYALEAPSANGNLADALRATAHEILGSTDLALEFQSFGTAHPLEPHAEAAVVRVAREAVVNAARHSRGKVVRVDLAFRPHTVRLRVADDGRGFAVDRYLQSHRVHWGLLGMRRYAAEVGGRLRITSRPERGTAVTLIVPDARADATDPSRGEAPS